MEHRPDRRARRATPARSSPRRGRDQQSLLLPERPSAPIFTATRAKENQIAVSGPNGPFPSRPGGRLRDQPLLPLPSASGATALASLATGVQTDLPPARDERDSAERRYVRAVLGRYLWLPDTPTQTSRHDRRVAQTLFARGVALLWVEAALLLGAARRALREPWLAPLPRVRALAYYLPVIAEVLENPREPDLEYLTCLLRRLRPLAEMKAARLAHEARYGRHE
jgi:hypothetical protein